LGGKVHKMERRYYLAAGNDETVVRDFFKHRNEAFDNATAVAKKHGGTAVTNGYRMCGVAFADDIPHGWKEEGRLPNGSSYYMPIRRSKSGKETSKEIRSILIPGASELHSKFSDDGGVYSDAADGRMGFIIYYITAEIINGQCIIQVPETMQFDPPESRSLKKSEYWQIKEGSESSHA